jgi:hypothetical protein
MSISMKNMNKKGMENVLMVVGAVVLLAGACCGCCSCG